MRPCAGDGTPAVYPPPLQRIAINGRAGAGKSTLVIEFQYDDTRPLILAHTDTLVWLDLPLAVTMWRVVGRTLSRREVEPWLASLSRDGRPAPPR